MNSDYLFFEGVTRSVVHRAVRRPAATPARPAETASEEADGFFALVLSALNLPAGAYRPHPLRRRLSACLRFLRVSTIGEAQRRLMREPQLARGTASVALLGVSEFFRDAAVFGRLEREVLPDLLERRSRLRVWSAGCSSGQELYSVAMLLAEAGRLGDCELVGTDCRLDAVQRAQAGMYPLDAVAKLPPLRRERFFHRVGQAAVVTADLRERIHWKTADLLAAPERGPWDLILWRNMVIYLAAAAADSIWHRLAGEMAPGGIILTGKADHLPPALPFARIASCIHRKHADADEE